MLIHRSKLALHNAASTDASRPALSAVHMSRDGRIATATDGHMLVRVTADAAPAEGWPQSNLDAAAMPNPPVKGLLIPAATAAAALKGLPRRCAIDLLRNNAALESANGKTVLATTDMETAKRHEAESMPVDCWPDVDSILQRGQARATVGLSLAVLEKLVKTLRAAAGPKTGVHIRFELKERDGNTLSDLSKPWETAVTFSATTGEAEVSGLVMPVRL